jgi:predicted XRE-type DNA-binding protein
MSRTRYRSEPTLAQKARLHKHEKLLQRAGYQTKLAANVLDVERKEGSELMRLGVVRYSNQSYA